MNILFTCDEYPPFITGGIGSVTKIVAEELVSRGHNVYVVGYYMSLEVEALEEEINGVHVYRYNKGYRRGKGKHYIHLVLNKLRLNGFVIQNELSFYENKIKEIIREKKIDVLELTDYWAFNTYNIRLKFQEFDIPTVLRVHGSASFIQELSKNEKPYAWENDKKHFERCTAISSVSRYSRNYVMHKFPDYRFTKDVVIYNPIEEEFINHTTPSAEKIILFIGDLAETKGIYSALRAFNLFHKTHRDWQLRIAGLGNRRHCLSIIDDDVKPNVLFLGFQNREQIKNEIDRCSFACIPSYFENFSMVPLEIMSRCRTLIYTERTSGKEIIDDGKSGFLVNPEDISQIADRICFLADNQQARNAMAEEAFDKCNKQVSCTDIVSDMEALYKSILIK